MFISMCICMYTSLNKIQQKHYILKRKNLSFVMVQKHYIEQKWYESDDEDRKYVHLYVYVYFLENKIIQF